MESRAFDSGDFFHRLNFNPKTFSAVSGERQRFRNFQNVWNSTEPKPFARAKVLRRRSERHVSNYQSNDLGKLRRSLRRALSPSLQQLLTGINEGRHPDLTTAHKSSVLLVRTVLAACSDSEAARQYQALFLAAVPGQFFSTMAAATEGSLFRIGLFDTGSVRLFDRPHSPRYSHQPTFLALLERQRMLL